MIYSREVYLEKESKLFSKSCLTQLLVLLQFVLQFSLSFSSLLVPVLCQGFTSSLDVFVLFCDQFSSNFTSPSVQALFQLKFSPSSSSLLLQFHFIPRVFIVCSICCSLALVLFQFQLSASSLLIPFTFSSSSLLVIVQLSSSFTFTLFLVIFWFKNYLEFQFPLKLLSFLVLALFLFQLSASSLVPFEFSPSYFSVHFQFSSSPLLVLL